jgi:hypothetical protein
VHPAAPYLVGQPYRMAPFEEALSYITGHDKVWLATGREIAQHFNDHYYDALRRSQRKRWGMRHDDVGSCNILNTARMRRYGMDHDRYDWSILPQRKPGGLARRTGCAVGHER